MLEPAEALVSGRFLSLRGGQSQDTYSYPTGLPLVLLSGQALT
jgi:hypothetical protein